MATDSERLIVALEARTAAFEKAMAKAYGIADSRSRQIEKRFLDMNAGVSRSFQTMLRASTALGAGLGIREIQQMADAWTDMSSRVGLAVGSMDLAPEVMGRIYDMAQRTYSSLTQTAEAFLGNATALRELGYSTNQQLDYTEALNNALVVSGAKAERAESVNNALSKAMALGALQGENLNTVIQTGGRVAELLAAELGVGVNQLRGLGKEGKITGSVIYSALTKNLEKLRKEADSMPATISDGFQKIGNALTKFVGTMDQASGISGTVAQGLVFVADNFEDVATAAAAASAVLLSRYAPALLRVAASQTAMIATNPFLLLATAIGAAAFALSAFGGEIQPVAGEMATLHDYAGAVWDSITDGVSVAAGVISDAMLGAINMMVSAMDGVEVSWSDVLSVVKSAANGIIGAQMAIYETAVTAFTKLPAAVADGVTSAMNAMIGYVEAGINRVVGAVNRAITAISTLKEWAGGDAIARISEVSLDRINNEYAGAGAAAGQAYVDGIKKAFTTDHLGETFDALRKRANERAEKNAAESAGGGSSPLDKKGVGLGSGASGSGSGKKKKANEYQREIEKIKERTAALQAETAAQAQLNPLIDDYDYAVTKAKAAQELLTAAQKAGIAITPELLAQIDQLAEGYAQATVESKKLAESQEEARQRAEEMRDLGKDVMGGFIKDLRDGKSATEAFANALDKVQNKLLDMALNSLFSGGGGMFGGLLGGIGGIFGFADGGIAAHGRPQPMKTFKNGGVSRSAAIFAEAGAEAAVPLPDGRRIPVDLRMPEQTSRGQDLNITVGVAADTAGNLTPFVQKVSRSVASQQVGALAERVPAMADARYNTRSSRRTRA